MKEIQNKVVVLTGAGSGIGRELALQFGALGAKLALSDWNKETLAETTRLLTAQDIRCFGKAFDVSNRAAMAIFAEDVWKRYGRIDVMINNAGISVYSNTILDNSLSNYERVFNVNIWGVLHGSQIFLPYLEQGEGGTLVNISSVFGLIGYAHQGPYVMSKFAVRGLTETLRQEYRGKAVNICCVHPGGVKTDLVRNIKHKDEQKRAQVIARFDKVALTTAPKAAAKIITGIRRRKKRIIVGPDARVIDILSRLFPSFYHRFLPQTFKPEEFKSQPTPVSASTSVTTEA